MHKSILSFLFIAFFFAFTQNAKAQTLDLSKAQIYTTITDKNTLLRSLEVLQNEIEKRSGIKYQIVKKLPKA
ncbi:MAG: hypothetical protein ABIN24_09960, partial [Dyadobacter sp.]